MVLPKEQAFFSSDLSRGILTFQPSQPGREKTVGASVI